MSAHRVEDAYPLSPLQEGMLFHALSAGEPGMYLTQVACTLAGPLDVACFERAWQSVARRHPALRTAFAWKSAESPIQVVGREVRIPLTVEDWRGLPAAEREHLWEERLATDRALGMDPARAPLLRLFLAREEQDLHRLLWTHHHLVLDGWSVGIVLQEASAAYAAALRGDEPAFPPAVPFRAYIAWLLRRNRTGAESFWRGELAGITAPTPLPWSAGRADAASDRDGERVLRLPEATGETVRARCRGWQITPGTLVYAAWAILLGRHAGEEDVVFGVTTAGRPADLAGVEGIVGLFINTLPLRVDVGSGHIVLPWLLALQERQMDMRSHEHAPLVEVQGWSDVPRGRPLFESFVAFESSPADRAPAPGEGELEVRGVRAIERTNYPLGVAASPSLAVRVTHDPRRFDAATVDRLLGHLGTLLVALVEDAGRPLGDLPLLGAGERAQLLAEWNDTLLPLPRLSVPDLIAARAAGAPGAIAVAAGGMVLSYGEMITRADLLARRLRGLGLRAGDVVGVSCGRTPDLVVALLGVLRAGCVFLPLDPSHPRERLDWIAADAGARLLVTPEWMATVGEGEAGLPPIDLGSPAYLIYTSGTTGRPKGVLVEHRALAATLLGTAARFGFDATDRMPCVAPVPFDIFLFELLSPLLAGGTAMLVPLAPALDVERLVDLLPEATRFHAVPALMRQVVDAVRARGGAARFAALRTLFVGGDAVPPRLREDLREVFPGVEVWVLYGPTEAAILCASHLVREEGEIQAPLGRPLPNVELRLCDPRGRLVPVGAPGELWIGGPGVARGYQGRDELTAERFPRIEGRRFYRSGDRARWRPDGTLEFLGRIDQQVKIRGVRIEPAEIESVLAALPEVRQAAVVAGEDGGAEKSLLACVVTTEDGPTIVGLRAALRERLPEAFVPSEIVLLDSLPLTAHGKVDRAALARLGGVSREGTPAGRPPQGPVEEVLAEIWAEVLGREKIGAEDDFFQLGGHSLLATRIVSRLRAAFNIELPVGALFEASSVTALARRVEDAWRSAMTDVPVPPLLTPVLRHGPLPASFAQRRLWFLDRFSPNRSYNVPSRTRLLGALDVVALAQALSGIVCRHEALRTRLIAASGEPVQVVDPATATSLPVVDLAGLPSAVREGEALRLSREEALRPFDLESGPLLRAGLLRLEEGEHEALLTTHHGVSDAWSMGILLRELGILYAARRAGEAALLPDLPVQYVDFASWQRSWIAGEVLDRLLAVWRRRLEGVAALDLPTDQPRSTSGGHRAGRHSVALPPSLTAALRVLCRSEKTSLFMLFLAVFQALLGRLAGQEDVCVGAPIAGRNRLETEGIIGLFVNTLAIRGDLTGAPDLRELLRRTRQVVLEAHAHQDLPFEKLVEELQPERDLMRSPLFQVALALQNAPREELSLPEVTLRSLPLPTGTAKFDLTLSLEEEGEGIRGTLEYDTDLFDAPTAARLAGAFVVLLTAAVADPSHRLQELPLLSPEERHQALLEWSSIRPASDVFCLHEELARRAAETPTAIALVCGEESLTYGDLLARSGRLASRLLRLGVRLEDRVPLIAERSIDLVVGLLGILRAGAAYVPVDPSYPAERVGWLLADSLRGMECPVVVTQERCTAALPEIGVWGARVVLLDGDGGWEDEPEAATDDFSRMTPDSAAYVIYTSGSTGRPKGVVVTHAAVARLFTATRHWFDFASSDVWTLFHSYAFDFSVWEIWGALLHGGRLVVVPYWDSRSPELFRDLLRREGVTIVNQTPSAFSQLLQALPTETAARETSLRCVIFGGEALDPELLRPWLEESAAGAVRLINMYGITETTVHVTFRPMAAADLAPERRGVSPIGLPIPDLRLDLVDSCLLPVPLGFPGEILVGGAGLARGYLGRPELTAERFVPDPFGMVPGARLYRSGDLARRRPDGTLEYLGRIDHQVKVRGYRIELGEVESCLRRHPGVADAVAVAREGTLVAYVVPRDPRPEDAELRSWLREHLPEPMVPAVILRLAAFPLTAHGKVDRRALPAPESEERSGEAPRPRSAAGEMLAALWAELLNIPEVGERDHFFHLGGHSLLATRLSAAVRRVFGIELPLRSIFERPVLAEMVEAVEELLRGDRSPAPPLVRASRSGALPLSFAQQRLWFFDRFEPGSSAYNVPFGVRLSGDLDPAALERSLEEIVCRHEILRTTYADVQGEPVQLIGQPGPFQLPLIDLAALPKVTGEAEALRLAADEEARPFDLVRGPVLRALLVRLAPSDHAALLTLHHIAADGWSTGVLIGEMTALYTALSERRHCPLPELVVQYADVAVWQREQLRDGSLDRQLAWWCERLRDLPVLELPTDRPRPKVQSHRGAQRATVLPILPELRALARREGATLFMVALAGLAAVLAHRSGQDDIVVGTNVAGRTRAETEGLIGFFLNMLVLRTDLSGNPDFRELLGRARETALGAYAHQDLPFDRLVEAMRVRRDPGRHPLFQVKVDFQSEEAPRSAPSGLTVAPLAPSRLAAHSDLTVYFAERPEGLGVIWEYNTDLFDAASVAGLASDLETVLRQALERPEVRLSELRDLLASAAERRRIEREREFQATRRDELRSFRRRAAVV